MQNTLNISRRRFIELSAAFAAGCIFPSMSFANTDIIFKNIPKTGENLQAIGMGTSRTFDAAGNSEVLERLQQVTQTFFDLGGGMIDSSPMYGSSEDVLGQILPRIDGKKDLFSATKVWIEGKENGIEQMGNSQEKWGVQSFDLMQIHNLVDWETHLETLEQMKAEGKIRYIGITTSHGRFHNELKSILKKYDFDFVQLTYNIGDRQVEAPLLNIAEEKGIAVIVNRPFQRGNLFRQVKSKPLPPWAKDLDINSWAQYFLKFTISHPAVTCAIPATSKVKHMRDNMGAGKGRLPDEKQRLKMIEYFESV